MVTWFFGASSDWSQRIISKLEGQVVQFSRSSNERRNSDIDSIETVYDPSGLKEWLDTVAIEQPKPDRVIFNINTGMVEELSSNIYLDIPTQFTIFNDWWINNKEQLFFRTTLMNWLHNVHNFKGDVCHITSQISADHNDNWRDLQLYKMLRAVDYEIIWNNRNYGMNAYGICPAANTRPMDWADFVAQEIQDPNIGIKYWLYGVGETPKGLKMVKYQDWGKTQI